MSRLIVAGLAGVSSGVQSIGSALSAERRGRSHHPGQVAAAERGVSAAAAALFITTAGSIRRRVCVRLA